MSNPVNITAQIPVGGTDMSALRRAARDNSPQALKAVAQQFEALLLNMMMKSMREATPKGGIFDSEQSRLYMSLLDQQISQSFAKRGMGLADALVRQMSATTTQPILQDQSATGVSSETLKQTLSDAVKMQQASLLSSLTNMPASENGPVDGLMQLLGAGKPGLSPAARGAGADLNISSIESKSPHVQAFLTQYASAAQTVSRESGIPAKFMLGQAALETGWGRNVMVCADGTSSHNLFGIKANAAWKGKVVESVTTEYVDGVAYKQTEKFRAYDSYADSFRDYANLLQTNPRYKQVLASGQDARKFAQSLQGAGYATDPQYAAKLTRIIRNTLS